MRLMAIVISMVLVFSVVPAESAVDRPLCASGANPLSQAFALTSAGSWKTLGKTARILVLGGAAALHAWAGSTGSPHQLPQHRLRWKEPLTYLLIAAGAPLFAGVYSRGRWFSHTRIAEIMSYWESRFLDAEIPYTIHNAIPYGNPDWKEVLLFVMKRDDSGPESVIHWVEIQRMQIINVLAQLGLRSLLPVLDVISVEAKNKLMLWGVVTPHIADNLRKRVIESELPTKEEIRNIIRNGIIVGGDLRTLQKVGIPHGDVNMRNILFDRNPDVSVPEVERDDRGRWRLVDLADPKGLPDLPALAAVLYGILTGQIIEGVTPNREESEEDQALWYAEKVGDPTARQGILPTELEKMPHFLNPEIPVSLSYLVWKAMFLDRAETAEHWDSFLETLGAIWKSPASWDSHELYPGTPELLETRGDGQQPERNSIPLEKLSREPRDWEVTHSKIDEIPDPELWGATPEDQITAVSFRRTNSRQAPANVAVAYNPTEGRLSLLQVEGAGTQPTLPATGAEPERGVTAELYFLLVLLQHLGPIRSVVLPAMPLAFFNVPKISALREPDVPMPMAIDMFRHIFPMAELIVRALTLMGYRIHPRAEISLNPGFTTLPFWAWFPVERSPDPLPMNLTQRLIAAA